MPEISRFFGIIITMFYSDHQPPHFHVRYGEYKAQVTIDPISILRGNLPPRVFGLVAEWALVHQEELSTKPDSAKQDRSVGVKIC
jgi:hypothetical protein